MISEQLRLLVEYRFSQAKQTLEEAKILVNNCAYRGSINRSYYAMFYGTMGLLSLKNIGSSKHSGVISFFDREFIKTGELSKDLSRSLHRAFEERQMSDYGEMLEPDELTARELIDQADVFISSIIKEKHQH
ncbi:UPF0332 protein [Planktothrix tepida]|uniref:HEPN domain-containing protein n=1 Tax=Planktothrix tepida PCC 9214 TaxID=671072 RepID=A0A1J1LQU8_9CYAN|nr:HEPN domain-containing protein [Planktothrix tepida]CAD5964518.1 UPF0332 protein [Planktothrix tepida]CUR34952.1 conserved hypothetical protein [Planktothrix tepida PCC 9214]